MVKMGYFIIFEIILLSAGSLLFAQPQADNLNSEAGQSVFFSENKSSSDNGENLQQTISGSVTDSNTEEPIPGANIYIEELETGTATNIDGDYTITIDEPGTYTLVATFVGYERFETMIELNADENLTLDIELVEMQILGEDVLVVGYGTQRRSDFTGSVASVSSDDLTEVTISSLESGLQGRVAGMNVTQDGTKPGSSATIRIRGNRSIVASNDPLFVVDGIPITTGLRDINPNDVQSIEVLKDASATAIYGSRGANGVVIVTTNRGFDGDMIITYDVSAGISQKFDRINTMNGEEWAELKREAWRAEGQYTSDADLFHPTELEQLQNGTWTDYQDMITKNGFHQQHQLSVAGGNENTRFNLGIGALDQAGILDPENFGRYTFRLNLDLDVTDRLRVGTSTIGSYSIADGLTRNFFGEALQNTPLTQPYDEDGNLKLEPKPDAQRTNPLIEVLPETYVDEEKVKRLLSNIYAEFDINNNLGFRMNFSPDLRSQKYSGFQNSRSQALQGGPATAQTTTTDIFEYTWENILNYQQALTGNQTLNVTGLFSVQEFTEEFAEVGVRGVPIETMKHFNLGAAEEILNADSYLSEWTIVSAMARVNYNYDDRYLLTLTGRSDGSSRFGEDNKWGFFPSAAIAWNIYNEDFWNNTRLISDLRVRLSVGETGQTAIDPYQSRGLLGRTAYNFGGTAAFGFKPIQIRNAELQWETTREYNLGVQLEMFDSQIVGEFDIYRQDTKDLLLFRALPTTSGFGEILQNVGSTRNQGFEANISAAILQSSSPDRLQWTIDVNASYNDEQIVELFGGDEDDVGSNLFIGNPVNVYYDFEKIGIWQSNEAAQAESYGQNVGEIKIRDVNGDGQITQDDRVILGHEMPKWTGGMTNRFSYKGFDLSVFLIARFGSMIQSSLFTGGTNALVGRYNGMDVDYWTPDNPTNDHPRPTINYETPPYQTTLSYFDGDFIKVRNIGLSYTLPTTISQQLGLSILKLYTNVEQPFIFAPSVNKGVIDPETSTGNNTPVQRKFVFGINLTF